MSSQGDSDSADSQEASAVDAIATVSDEGKRIRWKLILAAVALIVAPMMIGAYKMIPRPKPAMDDVPVAILLPAKTVRLPEPVEPLECEGAVSNAQRQKQGFELAFEEHVVVGEKKRYVEYCFDLLNGSADEVEKEAHRLDLEIQRLYKEEGIRIFLVTMSGAAAQIKDKFTPWSENIDPANRPVLIATVASAPGIADLKQGVLRHYIRSKDESELLSNYIESLQPTPKLVGVFYVDDDYGVKARDLLEGRIKNGDNFETYQTEVVPDAGDVDDLVEEFIRDQEKFRDVNSDTLAVAVIVGYGEMIGTTLTSLMNESVDVDGTARQFAGQILPVSTFTEKSWRPSNLGEDFAKRIHTIDPGIDEDNDDYRGVVFQFSAMTLDRALTCKGRRGAESFWSCWIGDDRTKNEKLKLKEWANVEFMADGDSRVELRMLDHDAWSK